MRAGVLIKIDQLSRLGDPGKRSGFCSNGVPHKGNNGPVMLEISTDVEHLHS
jgi:hypothetical protein